MVQATLRERWIARVVAPLLHTQTEREPEQLPGTPDKPTRARIGKAGVPHHQESGEVIEEGRLRTSPEALRGRFASLELSLRIAIDAGTHSLWVSRDIEGCGHELLVAKAHKIRLIYTNKRKTD